MRGDTEGWSRRHPNSLRAEKQRERERGVDTDTHTHTYTQRRRQAGATVAKCAPSGPRAHLWLCESFKVNSLSTIYVTVVKKSLALLLLLDMKYFYCFEEIIIALSLKLYIFI